MTNLKLTNDFHRTCTIVRVALTDGRGALTAAQVRRAKRLLCGVPGCACSDGAGQRPTRHSLIEQSDGGATVEVLS